MGASFNQAVTRVWLKFCCWLPVPPLLVLGVGVGGFRAASGFGFGLVGVAGATDRIGGTDPVINGQWVLADDTRVVEVPGAHGEWPGAQVTPLLKHWMVKMLAQCGFASARQRVGWRACLRGYVAGMPYISAVLRTRKPTSHASLVLCVDLVAARRGPTAVRKAVLPGVGGHALGPPLLLYSSSAYPVCSACSTWTPPLGC